MLRQIYIVRASVVDSNGSWSEQTGYPKKFDSKDYDNDIDKTLKRAKGDAAEAWSKMCKNDTRQVQLVTVTTADGFEILKYLDGKLAELPDPEPDPEPEPEPSEE